MIIIGIIGLFFSLIFFFKYSTPQTNTKEDTNLQNISLSANDQKTLPITPKIPIATNKTTTATTLNITMPWTFFNNAFIAMADEIQKKENINIHYHSIDNPNTYQQYIQSNITGNDFDIFLIPLDWLDSLTTKHQIKKIQIDEDTTNYVLPLFSTYNSPQYTLIAHAIDPLVTFIAKDSHLQYNQRTMSQTLSYLNIANMPKKVSLPVARGISKNDIRLLEQNKESFPNYFSILYNFLYQFAQNKDQKSLNAMLKLSQINPDTQRDYVKFIQLIKKIQKRNQYCKIYPDTCLFAYKFSDIKFGYLSDLTIRNHFFDDSNRKFKDIDIVNFPLSSQTYKVRGRAFVINSTSDKNKTPAIKTYFNYYLQAWVTNKYALWDNILSAHNAIFDFQKSQKKYQNIMKYQKSFSLIHAWRDLQKDFLSQTNTINLLKGEVDPQTYLNQITRKR